MISSLPGGMPLNKEASVDYLDFKDRFLDLVREEAADDGEAFRRAVRLMAKFAAETEGFSYDRLHFRDLSADDPKRTYDFFAFEEGILHLFFLDSQLFERDDETVSMPMMRRELQGTNALCAHAQSSYATEPTGEEDAHSLCSLILSRMSKGLPVDVDGVRLHFLALNEVPKGSAAPAEAKIGNLRVEICVWSPSLCAFESFNVDETAGEVFAKVSEETGNSENRMPGEEEKPKVVSPTAATTEPPRPTATSAAQTVRPPVEPLRTVKPVENSGPRVFHVSKKTADETASATDHSELMPSRFYRPPEKETTLDIESNSAEEFRRKVLQNAGAEGSTAYGVFNSFVKSLVHAGIFEDIRPADCSETIVGSRKIALSGYAYDPNACVLSLFILDWGSYVYWSSPSPMLADDFERLTQRLKNFYLLASRNQLIDDVLDAETDEGMAAGDIFRWSSLDDENKIQRVQCVVLTLRPNGMRKKEWTEEFPFGPDGPSCVSFLYDYRALYELSHSVAEIVIDFDDPESQLEPVHMLETVNTDDGYRAYLGRMPAANLARIYERYGQRVLSGNVRAFLQSNNRVNKGMLKTAREDAPSFFAYNNGICVVVRDLETIREGNVDRIVRARDFQIVNGGQTTATLHMLWSDIRRKFRGQPEADNALADVCVPMKLTAPAASSSERDREKLVMNISKYANSQSKVSDSDLGANTHFQIKFKAQSEHSRCAIRPSVGNNVTYWYYERSRGSYKVEVTRDKAVHASRKKSAKTPFELRYPKKFSKTDLAKWIKSWDMAPDIVSRGAQKCYAAFEEDVRRMEARDPSLTFITPEYVKYCLGKGLLFTGIDDIVKESAWYQESRSYKANLVTYAMAYLSLTLKRLFGPEADFDFLRLWDEQELPARLVPLLDLFARLARDTFDWEERSWSDVGEWVKKSECWARMSSQNVTFGESERRFLREWTVLQIPDFDTSGTNLPPSETDKHDPDA